MKNINEIHQNERQVGYHSSMSKTLTGGSF